MTAIGPTFGAELKKAGVPLDGIVWYPNGEIDYGPLVSDGTKAQVATVLAAHDHTKSAVPQSVTRTQGKLQLSRAGLLIAVNTIVSGADLETQIWYADSAIWERNHPKVLALAAALTPPLSSDDIDSLFIAAAQII